jgi:hypothetical protein
MAPKPADQTPDTTPQTTDPQTPGTTPDAATEFDWNELDGPLEMPSKQGQAVTRIDVITEIPELIRARAEESLGINAVRVAAKLTSRASRPRVDYFWLIQPVKSEAMGKKFCDLMLRYAKYRPSDGVIPFIGEESPMGQVTCRMGEIGWYKTDANNENIACTATAEGAFLAVRYSVRPFEQRSSASRLPGQV